ncbi:MAG TPA: endo-1,4-beta-xylanase [Polyangiaceae bacterium]
MRKHPFHLVALTAILSTAGCASDAGTIDGAGAANGGTDFVGSIGGSSSSSDVATGGVQSTSNTEGSAVGGVSSASTRTTAAGGARNTGTSSEVGAGGRETTTTSEPSLGGTQPGTATSSRGGASGAATSSRTRGGASSAGGAPSAGGSSSAAGSRTTGGAGGASTTPTNTAGALSVTKFVGNITTGDTCDTSGKTYSKHWNQITPENAGKWGSVQSSAGSAFNWRTLDAIYDYTQKNNIIFKEHAFIWGAQQPGGSIDETAVKNWMTEFCKRYPNTKVIDVVNEPPPHTTPSYAANIGGGTNGDWKWITNAFTWARAACKDSILLLNDFNNIEWTNDNAHFIDIVKKIKAAGAPIDAIGAQSHDLDHASVTFSTVKTLLAKLNADTGLPIYITEYDISTTDDTKQLNAYKEHFDFFLNTSYIHGVTVWGWIFGRTWNQAPDSGLVRNGTPRPAMTWLMQELGRPTP